MLKDKYRNYQFSRAMEFSIGTPAQVFLGLAGERDLSIDAIMTLQNKLGSYNNDILTAYGLERGPPGGSVMNG